MSEENNDQCLSILLEEWKICVDMANSVSARRDSVNALFVTINVALITAVSFSFNLKSLFVITVGIVLNIAWMHFINNYKELNTEKFKVINSLEKHLPVQPFNEEWEGLKTNEKYKDLTALERNVSVLFIFIYVGLLISVYVAGG